MRAILWLVAAAVVLYGGYWGVGSRVVLDATRTALAGMKSDGLAEYGTVTLTGFPSRFDLRVDAPGLMSADGQIRWQAAFLQIYALSYQPQHIIAVWPQDQTLAVGTEKFDITSDDMRASAVFGLGTDLPLDRAQMVARNPRVAAKAGWVAEATELRLAIRRSEPVTYGQDAGAELLNLTIGGDAAVRFAGAGGLAPHLDRARIDAGLEFDGPVDRLTVERGLRLRAMNIRALEIDWGDAEMRGDGMLTVNAAGQLEGSISLRVTNWRAVLAAAIATGVVAVDIAPTVERTLEQMSMLSGDPQVVALPLVFARGWMRLGPVPLGPAPRF